MAKRKKRRGEKRLSTSLASPRSRRWGEKFWALINEKISRFSVKLGFAVSILIEGHGKKIDVPIDAAA
jgi:hypothetical protein